MEGDFIGDKTTSEKRGDIQRHESLWFEDGNVVLVAEDRVGLKLHKSVLSRHSALLKDMFSLPQLANSSSLDGCPVVHINDSISEMTSFLSVIYNCDTR